MTTISPYNYFMAAFSGQSLSTTPMTGEASGPKTSTLNGMLSYNDDHTPAQDLRINCFVQDYFGVPHFIGSTKTDMQGRFHLDYSLKNMWFWPKDTLTMRIVEEHLPFAEHGIFVKKEVTLQKIDKKINVSNRVNDLGTIQLNFNDISPDIKEIPPPLPSHRQPPSYFLKLFRAILPELPKIAILSLFGKYMTIEQIQKLYDSFGPSYVKRPATPANLIDELLNHVSAVTPEINGTAVAWTANWDGLEFDKGDSLPNIKVSATKDDNGRLRLKSISIKFREDAIETVVMSDDKRLGWAIHLARSVFVLKGEAEVHLGEGHILPGIISKAFFKHIKSDNPMFAPLEPHLSQIDFINWFGSKGIIFGSGSVLENSALDDKSVTELMLRSIKEKANWLDYDPPKAFNASHYRALGERLHFQLLLVFFNRYVQKHKLEISRNWSSIYNWSQGVHELIQTFPPITTNASMPTELDLLKLAKCAAWLTTKTTFLHWAAHSRQQLLTDIRQASLAIEKRGLDKDGNHEPFGNTFPENGAAQLRIARTLLNFSGDSIFKNPNGDMDKDLLKMLQMHIAEYKGYDDIIKMHLTTQI